MSSIYNLEPQPTGSAIIHTTHGDISVELFAKQTPLTCRNFLQLSLDGYYDGTIFHRLVPGFILQGGDPTGTGNGGESIYDGGAFSGDLDPWPMDQRRGKNAGPTGINFKDEIHSRLKFNRRGLLGMANEGTPDTNGSQFFFTLGKTEELTGKNTVFGRVAGNTIYNLLKMGETDVEEGGERPLYPTKITSIEILVNPFQDMEKRERVARKAVQSAPVPAKKQKKRKGGKQLLSFADEEGDAEDLPVIKKTKFDTRIVVDNETESESPARIPKAPSAGKKESRSKKDATRTVSIEVGGKNDAPPSIRDRKASPVRRSKSPSRSRSRSTQRVERKVNPQDKDEASEPGSESESEAAKKSALDRTNEEIAALKASMRRTIHTERPAQEKKVSALEQLIPKTSIQGRRRRPGEKGSSKNDQKTLKLLQEFQEKLSKQVQLEKAGTPNELQNGRKGTDKDQDDGGEVCDLHFIANCQSCQSWDKMEKEEESDDEGWMSHTLNFAADKLGKDLSYRKKAEEELVVIDPLEKARTLKEEKRATREGRSGASRREWDQARNAQMARVSALAGRGAK